MTKVATKKAKTETDTQIEKRLRERMEVLRLLTTAAMSGDAQAAIISGPPGLGKSYEIEEILKQFDPNGVNTRQIKGYVRATGLYKMLYAHRLPGQVLIFDDADSVFFDETALNLLKGACDTTETRRISWMSEATFVDEETGDVIPSSFEFGGVVLFLTNIDFDAYIAKGHKLAPHLEAMISRAHYVDMDMKSRRDYLVRIRMAIKDGLLDNQGLTSAQKADVIHFIETHYESVRELSLRIAIKLANLRKMKCADWEAVARITCLKTVKG